MADPKPAGDEIEDIMKEINEIQKDLVSSSKKPDLKVIATPPATSAAPTAAPAEEMSLNDFRGGGDEPGMEEMLGDIKDETPADQELMGSTASEASESKDDDEDEDENEDEMKTAEGDPEETPGESVDELDQMLKEAEAEAAAATAAAKSPEESESVAEDAGDDDDSSVDDSPGEDGTLSMTLSGQMKLKLKYAFSGQEVSIRFDDGALRVELSDGTEFKVPVASRGTAGKKAA